jgi:hypothetical protein
MTYDQWKTTDPADDAPVCECCGGYLRGYLGKYECPACADERDFYEWEPEGQVTEEHRP